MYAKPKTEYFLSRNILKVPQDSANFVESTYYVVLYLSVDTLEIVSKSKNRSLASK